MRYKEGVVDVGEDGVLGDDVVDLLETEDFGLLEHFEGNVVASLLLAREADAAERASAQSLQDLVLLQLDLDRFESSLIHQSRYIDYIN